MTTPPTTGLPHPEKSSAVARLTPVFDDAQQKELDALARQITTGQWNRYSTASSERLELLLNGLDQPARNVALTHLQNTWDDAANTRRVMINIEKKNFELNQIDEELRRVRKGELAAESSTVEGNQVVSHHSLLDRSLQSADGLRKMGIGFGGGMTLVSTILLVISFTAHLPALYALMFVIMVVVFGGWTMAAATMQPARLTDVAELLRAWNVEKAAKEADGDGSKVE